MWYNKLLKSDKKKRQYASNPQFKGYIEKEERKNNDKVLT